MEGLDALKISEEKKKYIVELLNPILEEMVAECIHRMPEDPVPFMLDYLEQKRVAEEEKNLTPEEKARLIAENEQLQASVDKVKLQMQEAAKLVTTTHDAEEEEEEDDEDDEPPPGFFEDKPQATKARASVSAEAYGEWNQKKAFVPPVITKTDEQKERLKGTLIKSFMFSSLDSNDLNIIIGAMKEVQVENGQRVIKQGEEGDFLFIIESGGLECKISQEDGGEKLVHTYSAGEVFGELALLYNCPRKANIDSKDKCILWKLDRDTFNHIVKEAAQKKRARYDRFLSKVPLLESMEQHERSQLADALQVEDFDQGKEVVVQGDNGRKFYIVEEGMAEASRNGQVVMSYQAGDYFGELALIRDQPRAATVTCKTQCRLLSIDAGAFKRLLNVNDLMNRATKYC